MTDQARSTPPRASPAVKKTESRKLYNAADWQRELDDAAAAPSWRTPVMRDNGRVTHSASFRRLQGKTQVFPGHESDFFRNRLTHSLEVSQIAQSIAERLNAENKHFKKDPIETRLCAVAGLVHDIGHPPFGHNGERALDRKMIAHGGFEGNAQTLRILARLEKKSQRETNDGADGRAGLNLTWRTLASVLKYDRLIPKVRKLKTYKKVTKGYYEEEKEVVRKIKAAVLGTEGRTNDFKTIECWIMDVADDIAYSTYDLEDSLKVGFLTPAGMLSADEPLLTKVASEVGGRLNRKFTPVDVVRTFTEIFDLTLDRPREKPLVDFIHAYRVSKNIAESSFFRTQLTSQLVNEFVMSVDLEYNTEFPMLSKVALVEPARTKVEVLKTFTYEATIYSSKVKLAEYRGSDIVSGIFAALSGEKGELLMPEDVREFFVSAPDGEKPRVICDFLAGMTDRYAMEFYNRLHSDGGESMFKPI